MSCEELRQRYVEALNEWVAVEERLNRIALSHVAVMPAKPKPIVAGSPEWEEWGRLLTDRDKLWGKYRDAENAYREARIHHHEN
jgi:hypothetical protein